MLPIISSNRQEALLDQLVERLRTPADANPLTPERVVAERGMNTWVMQQLADRHGIAANIELQLPAAFVWQTLRVAAAGHPAAVAVSEFPFPSRDRIYGTMDMLDGSHALSMAIVAGDTLAEIFHFPLGDFLRKIGIGKHLPA